MLQENFERYGGARVIGLDAPNRSVFIKTRSIIVYTDEEYTSETGQAVQPCLGTSTDEDVISDPI